MTSIHLQGLGITAGQPLFSDLSLVIGDGDRLGLVAGNGGGKTSLFKVIMGHAEPASGTITRSRGTTVALVEQDVPANLAVLTVRDAVATGLPPTLADDHWRIDVALDEFAVPEALRDQIVSQLSGGWRRMVLMARATIGMPDMLLLDEPTNHLDLTRILALETWIAQTRTPMVIASHDRRFLDATTNRTLFLRPTGSRLYALPYSSARQALDEADAADADRQARDLKQAKQLRRRAGELYNVGVNSGSDLLLSKAKQLKARAGGIEAAQKILHRERSGDIRLETSDTHARVALAGEKLVVSTPDGRRLFGVDKLHVFQGERVALLGANGSGKTLLMKLLHRAFLGAAVEGLRVAPSLVVGYADQDLGQLDPAETAFTAFSRRFDVQDQRLRDLLAGAGIAVEKQGRPMAELSLGQRSRLGLLALRLTAPSLYLLDEPTNHIDIAGQERLESEIVESGATCVLVSHDRAFVDAVATRFLEIRKGRLVEVDGPEDFYAAMVG
jgi:ATPase subunit of ABC transporter with duplicated ATPase domains